MTQYSLPQEIYRYRKGDMTADHFLDDLVASLEGKVWLSSASSFEDRIEGRPRVLKSNIRTMRREYLVWEQLIPWFHPLRCHARSPREFRQYAEARRKWGKDFVRRGRDNLHIACFTDARSTNSERMWLEYARNSTGYRLHFNREPEEITAPPPWWSPVHYTDAGRTLSDFELLQVELQLNKVDVFAERANEWLAVMQSFVAVKREKYCWENEFRLIRHSKPEKPYTAVPGYTLAAITVGENATEELVALIAKHNKRAIPVFRQT